MNVRLNLVVIRSGRLVDTVRFYEACGLRFNSERHGSGPEHFAADCGGLVFEVYPATDGAPPDTSTRLGLAVNDPEQVLAELRELSVQIVQPLKSTPWGLRAVVLDPDGRKVEITANEIAMT